MALVITRKDLEEVLIGDDILITVHLTQKNQIKLEIDAPAEVIIQRGELVRSESSSEEDDYLKRILSN